jgi:hypothetical protein
LFTTLKYYPSNDQLFRERLLRYARTVPHAPGATLVFEYVSILKSQEAFRFLPVAEFLVDPIRGRVTERILDASVSVRDAHAASPLHEGARPGSYAPLTAG